MNKQIKKSRTLTNKKRDSFRVDVIYTNEDLISYYFKTEKEANKFLDLHELTDEQLMDKEYIKTLWENFQENRL